jgi:alkaline phosphatase D
MLNRRALLRNSAAGAAVLLLPQATARAAALRGGKFRQGVLSGDPTPDGITLLTLLDEAEGKGSVRLEVATDAGFRKVVASRRITTSAKNGYSVKARIKGLDAHERYYYRFETANSHSPVGRFQTALPEDSNETVRFAFFSCADYTHGYYNAYALMEREDVDFVVCLGDYIYAEAYHAKGKTGVRDDKIGKANSDNPGIVREAVTLDDYRAKYALYRSDKTLRDLHAKFPMITTWDDHEVQDNYAGAAPGGGLDPAKHFTAARKANGYKAFFEAMPVLQSGKSRLYRALRFGKNIDLLMLDQRQYRDDQPCGDAVAPACADIDAPRAYLGRTQMNFAKQRLQASDAAWKVVGNELMMMNAELPGGNYYTFDNWQGYRVEREELLAHIKNAGIKDVIFITGDIHTFIAGDVRTANSRGESVALEFVGGSITSQSLGETDLPIGGGQVLKGNDANPNTAPAIIDVLRQVNPWVDQADFDHHGYGLVKADAKTFDVTLQRVPSIKKRSTAKLPATGFRYTVSRGQTSIKGVNGPPAT